MKTYIAKTPHKRTCDLCGDAILPGDRVQPWCWWNFEGDKGVPIGGICRTHATCYTIGEREGLMEESLRDLESTDDDRHENYGEDNATKLADEAAKALAASRATRQP